jgi:hypothetical protein
MSEVTIQDSATQSISNSNSGCHRYVVIGRATAKYAAGVSKTDFNNQGQGDTGKNGLDFDTGKQGNALGGETGGPFKKGVFVIKGDTPIESMGAIEFPTFGSACAWFETKQGEAFLNRYASVVIVATHACRK